MQELFGGRIYRAVLEEQDHSWGVVDGNIVDLTEDQFDRRPDYRGATEVSREQLLANPDTVRRLDVLRSRFDEKADLALAVADWDHVAIRDPDYVAGTSKRPEVTVFAQSRVDRTPIKDNRIEAGQRVWMKWTEGPIVASASVQSWHTVRFERGNVNRARELTLGTKLFGTDDYWKAVQEKTEGWVTVVRLRDEQWLDVPIYPSGRAYGSSWLYLDTLRKQIVWLSKSWDRPAQTGNAGRDIPAGMAFQVRRRDNFTCRYCGARDVPLHIDHVIPWSEVRCHEMHNLVVACVPCNLGKSNKPLRPDQIARFHEENIARGA